MWTNISYRFLFENEKLQLILNLYHEKHKNSTCVSTKFLQPLQAKTFFNMCSNKNNWKQACPERPDCQTPIVFHVHVQKWKSFSSLQAENILTVFSCFSASVSKNSFWICSHNLTHDKRIKMFEPVLMI